MKLGQPLNGYTVITRPSNTDAGKCLWALADKDGERYFVKEFLDPKIPKPDSMGSVADKQRRYDECLRFARRHERLMELLPADHVNAGNLVLAADFFAVGTRYYKVTRWIEAVGDSPADLEPRAQLVLLRTLADSLRLLHARGIVHGDLKPENVMLTRPGNRALLVAKLIDFDDAYPVGDPPPASVVGGNPLYGAPEWLRYLRGDRSVPPEELTGAVDVFAFGLLIHTYLTGRLPGHGTDHESPAAAVLDGVDLDWDARLGRRLRALLGELTSADRRDRPSIEAVDRILAEPDVLTTQLTRPTRIVVDTTPQPPRTGRLRINLTRD